MRGEGRSVCHDYREKIGGVLLDNWKESRETAGYICPLFSSTRFLLIQTELFPSVLMVAFSFPDRTGLFKLRPRSVGQSVSNRVLRTKLTIVR